MMRMSTRLRAWHPSSDLNPINPAPGLPRPTRFARGFLP